MEEAIKLIYNYILNNNPTFQHIVNETENMSWQEIAAKYNIKIEEEGA